LEQEGTLLNIDAGKDLDTNPTEKTISPELGSDFMAVIDAQMKSSLALIPSTSFTDPKLSFPAIFFS